MSKHISYDWDIDVEEESTHTPATMKQEESSSTADPEYHSEISTSRYWALTLDVADTSVSRMAGEVVETTLGSTTQLYTLIGSLETKDSASPGLHVHCLTRATAPTSKAQTVGGVRRTLLSDHRVPVTTMWAGVPINRRGYIKYMYKMLPNMLDHALIRAKESGFTIEETSARGVEKELDKLLRQAKEHYETSGIKMTEPLLFEFCREKMGFTLATRNRGVIKAFADQAKDEECTALKRRKVEALMKLSEEPVLDMDIGQLAQYVLAWVNKSTIRVPGEPTIGQSTATKLVVATMYLMADSPRIPDQSIKQLWFSSIVPGLGKSTMTKLVVGHMERGKTAVNDAQGVGRWDCSKDVEVFVFEEATYKNLVSQSNLSTFNQLLDGRSVEVKVSGATKLIQPLWCIVNSNEKLNSLTMADQTYTSQNNSVEHSYVRRFIEVEANVALNPKACVYINSRLIENNVQVLAMALDMINNKGHTCALDKHIEVLRALSQDA